MGREGGKQHIANGCACTYGWRGERVGWFFTCLNNTKNQLHTRGDFDGGGIPVHTGARAQSHCIHTSGGAGATIDAAPTEI